jgi:hypothetical protein
VAAESQLYIKASESMPLSICNWIAPSVAPKLTTVCWQMQHTWDLTAILLLADCTWL